MSKSDKDKSPAKRFIEITLQFEEGAALQKKEVVDALINAIIHSDAGPDGVLNFKANLPSQLNAIAAGKDAHISIPGFEMETSEEW